MSYGITVFDDVLAFGGVGDKQFVAHWGILKNLYRAAVYFNGLTFFESTQTHYDSVGWIDFDK